MFSSASKLIFITELFPSRYSLLSWNIKIFKITSYIFFIHILHHLSIFLYYIIVVFRKFFNFALCEPLCFNYVIKSHPTNETIFAEIQVRTIFEEAWSELDHDVRYPYDIDNELLRSYLIMFNRLAGTADEMGSFIKHLADNLREQEHNYANQIDNIKVRIKTLTGNGGDIDTILNELDVLKSSFLLTHLHGGTKYIE
nr:hypothetical protein [Clostridium thermarum]